jgi:hypothetical protein
MSDTQVIRSTCCPFCGTNFDDQVGEIDLAAPTDPHGRELTFTSFCCDDLRDAMADWPRETWQQYLGAISGQHLRSVLLDQDHLLHADYGITLDAVSWAEVKQFVRLWHRHNKPPVGFKVLIGAYNGTELIGVGILGRPINRILQDRGYLEVTRVCIKPCHPHGLEWNACSMLYGRLCREAKKRGAKKVCTYVLTSESGISVRAAGFEQVKFVRGRKWRCKARPDATDQIVSTVDKWRYDREVA